MYSQIKFSVVIPCYNRETLVARAIRSVLAQTYTNLEIIVVDDASTDNSVQVVRESFFDTRLRVITLAHNSGVHAARNAGIDAAKGDYIVFLDSDDEHFPDALESFYSVLITDEKISIVSAPYVDDDAVQTGLFKETSGYVSYEELLCMSVSKKNKASIPCVSRSLVGDIRFAAPNVDFIFYRYLMRKGTTYYIARPLGIYHRVASSGNLNYERKLPKPNLSIVRAQAIDAFLLDFKVDLKKHCPKLLAGYSYGACVGLLLGGKQLQAIKRAFDAMYYGGFPIFYTSIFFFTIIPFSPSLLRFSFILKKQMIAFSAWRRK